MSETDQELLPIIARRNWIILALLVIGSLAWRSMSVTGGVAAGGLIVIVGHTWRQRALTKLLTGNGGRFGFQFGYVLRLAVFGAAIYLLIVPLGVHPLALAVGLSVVVINLLWTTLQRTL